MAKQYSDYARQIQETLDELHHMQEPLRLVTSPDECEAWAREMRQRTDHLGSVLVGYHRQQALDAASLQAEQVQLVSQWPKLLKQIRWQGQGMGSHVSRADVLVWVTYYRRKGQR